MHVVTVRSTAVREENHDLMNRFWVLREVVPEHIGILQMRLWVTLLGMNEVRELGWTTMIQSVRQRLTSQ